MEADFVDELIHHIRYMLFFQIYEVFNISEKDYAKKNFRHYIIGD
jgi:hypothetical protein